jgi:glycosyltransferase involved in cell wall biosynthesis
VHNDPVLLATNTYGLLGGEINGVAYTCRNLVDQFRAAGLRVDVLTYGWPERIEVVDDCVRLLVHDPVHGFNIDPALRIDPFFAAGAMAAEAAATSYSLVHTTTPDPLGWFAASLARKQDIPLVGGYHTLLDQYVRIRCGARLRIAGIAAEQFMRGLLDWYYGRVDLILAPSDAVRTMLELRFDAPVATLTRGVDAQMFSPQHRTRTADGEIRALYVGRIAEEKGLDKLVERFSQRGPSALTVVGDGPWAASMQRELPNARYTGRLVGDALSREFADADYFVFPSETDSFGNVVLQAMCSGLAVIVMEALGAKQSVIPNVTGFVVRDRAELAAACDRLERDAALRRRMGAAARAHALMFRWKDIFAQMLRLYASAGWSWREEAIAA